MWNYWKKTHLQTFFSKLQALYIKKSFINPNYQLDLETQTNLISQANLFDRESPFNNQTVWSYQKFLSRTFSVRSCLYASNPIVVLTLPKNGLTVCALTSRPSPILVKYEKWVGQYFAWLVIWIEHSGVFSFSFCFCLASSFF